MGSFLLRTYLYTYPDAVDKAVISGTGWEDPMKVRMGKLVCKLEEARIGEKNTSALVTKLMFGSYNRAFGPVTSPNAWICSDDAVVAAYDADPLCPLCSSPAARIPSAVWQRAFSNASTRSSAAA